MRRTFSGAISRLVVIVCLILSACIAGETADTNKDRASWTHSFRARWSRLVYYKNINAINFATDDYAYLGMDNATIAVSRDNGRSFRQVKVPIDGNIMQLASSNTGTVLVWNSTSYAISYDHGETWTPYRLDPSTTIQTNSTAYDRPGIVWLELVTNYRAGENRVGKVVLRRHARDRAAPIDQALDQ
jgi:hypothetical protein